MLGRLAARVVTSGAAFLVAGLIDFAAYVLPALGAAVRRRVRLWLAMG